MTLTDSIGRGWRGIRTAKELRAALVAACARLRELDRPDIAERWEKRLRRQPRRMAKEAINCVLLLANLELERELIAD